VQLALGLLHGKGLSLPFIQFLSGLCENIPEFTGRHRFQDVTGHLDLDRLPGIIEIIKACNDDHRGAPTGLVDQAGQLQTTHAWHADIRDDQIRILVEISLGSLLSIFTDSHDLETILEKIDHFQDGVPGKCFVLDDHQLVHRVFGPRNLFFGT